MRRTSRINDRRIALTNIKAIEVHSNPFNTNPKEVPAAGGCSVLVITMKNIPIPTDKAARISSMYRDSDGWYIEPSYRWKAGMGELGVYARYEEIDRSRTGARFEEERYSTGFNYWPTDQVAFKFTYETVEDVDASTNTDNFYFGIGYQF